MREHVPARIADLPLRDQDGHEVSLQDLEGKFVVLAPELTLCQETCPMTSANMHRAALDEVRSGTDRDVVFVEMTVDPWRDTTARLHAYERLFGALPDWSLLTGTPRVVKQLWEKLGVSMKKVYGDDKVTDWMTGKTLPHPYDVRHQDLVYILDPSGTIRWIRLAQPDARKAGPLPPAMRAFLSEGGVKNLHSPELDSWTASDVEKALTYLRQQAS